MNHFFSLFLILYLLTFLAAYEGTTTQPPQEEGVVVSFRVVNSEEYKIHLTDPADIEIARKLLAGEEAPPIPNGIVVRGDPDVNRGYRWQIDPESAEFVGVTTEV